MATISRLVLTIAITVIFGIMVATWINQLYGRILEQISQIP
jgi:hypothetical protein